MFKLLQNTILLLIGIFICGNFPFTNAFGKQIYFGIHGNAITNAVINYSNVKLRTGYGAGVMGRFWHKSYFLGMGIDYYQQGIHWKPDFHTDDRTYNHPKNARTLEIFPEAGIDLFPLHSMNLLLSIAPSLCRSDMARIGVIHDPYGSRFSKIKPHELDWGLNFGVALEIPMNKKLSYTAGLKYHLLFTDFKKTRFLTIFAGVVL